VFNSLQNLMKSEVPIEALILESPTTPALTDDRPINEYYVLRRKSLESVSENVSE